MTQRSVVVAAALLRGHARDLLDVQQAGNQSAERAAPLCSCALTLDDIISEQQKQPQQGEGLRLKMGGVAMTTNHNLYFPERETRPALPS